MSEEKSGRMPPPSWYLLELGSRISTVLDLYDDRKSASEAAGKSVDQLQAYMRAKSAPPFEVLARLAAGKGVNLNWLAHGQGEMFIQDTRPSMTLADTPVSDSAIPPELRRQKPEAALDRSAAESLQQAAIPAAAFDEDLHGRVVEGVMTVYKEEGAGLPPRHLGQLAARIHGELVAAYADPMERQIGLKLALEQLRRELRSTGSGEASSKRLA